MATAKEKKQQLTNLINLVKENKKLIDKNYEEKKLKEEALEEEMIAPLEKAIEELEKTIEDMRDIIDDHLLLPYKEKRELLEKNIYENLREFVLEYFPIGSIVELWQNKWSILQRGRKGVVEIYDKEFSAPFKLGKYESYPSDGDIIVRFIEGKKDFETILSVGGYLDNYYFQHFCLEGQSYDSAEKIIQERKQITAQYIKGIDIDEEEDN